MRSSLRGRLELLIPCLASLPREQVRALLPWLVSYDSIEDERRAHQHEQGEGLAGLGAAESKRSDDHDDDDGD